MIDVRRADDSELCGFVAEADGSWRAHTVFGSPVGVYPDRASAEQHVLDEGLAYLSRHWLYRQDETDDWQICCIQEASPSRVRVALDYYSMPGVPIVSLTNDEARDRLRLPDESDGV